MRESPRGGVTVPRIRVDVVVVLVVVLLVLRLAPGHGVWGWVVGFVSAAAAGAITGLLGRRYPQIYGQRRRGGRR
jgi:hydrogenase/urease accessory protein HupE